MNPPTLHQPLRRPTRFVGIDPGTNCGYAVLDEFGTWVASGVWDLKPSRHEGGGMRYLRLERYLFELLQPFIPVYLLRIGYEEVRRHAGTDAAHIYGGVLATLQRICESESLPYLGLPVGTIKKAATGKGNAGKAEMLRAARARWSVANVTKEDEADALWVAETLRNAV